MHVLLTGAFGNIGAHTLEELLQRDHRVRCFDVRTKRNEKIARKYKERIEVVWGDLRNPQDVAAAVQDQEVVIHLAFVIPTLSVTGVSSEKQPDFAYAVNVEGTRNLLEALKPQPVPPRLIFASSLHVYGPTQDQQPPRTASDPVHPIEHYAQHKVICEGMVKESGLEWAIFRLPATLPIRLILDMGMFDVPLENRIEYGHGRDVGAAFANGVDCPEIWGQTLLIGGGPHCQFHYRELVGRIMDMTGIGMLPAKAFSRIPFSTDWLDTSESQRLLKYQTRTLDDYLKDMRHLLGWRLPFIRAFRPFVRSWLLRHSPYLRAAAQGTA
jgi:nucleoside-diphosphate-sugar epimerase